MSNSIFTQKFAANFTGIDGEMSALEEDIGGVNRAVNLEYAVGNSLRGRVGCQVQGAHGFFGLFKYPYSRTQDQYVTVYQAPSGVYPNQTSSLSTTKTTADGASINKLIALNQQLWSLENYTYTVSRVSGSYPFTWYTAVSGSNINFNIKANGVSILNTSLGDGISSSTSIYSLLGTIDGLAELSINRGTRGICPPFAVVNGNQTTSSVGSTLFNSSVYRITVDAGHTFYPGDIITFTNATIFSTGYTGMLVGGVVEAIGATTIDYAGPQLTLVDDAVLGYMGQPASMFPISTAASAASGSLSIVIPYWQLIPEEYNFGTPFINALTIYRNKTSTSFYAPPTSEAANGDLYLATSGSSTGSFLDNKLCKTDTKMVGAAGLPDTAISGAVGGGGVLTGNYRYKAHYRRYDSQGNIYDGPIATSDVVVATADYLAVTASQTTLHQFDARSCYKSGTESPTASEFFNCYDGSGGTYNDPFIQPGDITCLLDDTTPLTGGGGANTGLWVGAPGGTGAGIMYRGVCTAFDGNTNPKSIKSTAANNFNILADSQISNGLTIVVYRTTAGGNTFYKLYEGPIVIGGSGISLGDNVNDSILVAEEQLIEPELGKEHDAPPTCSLVTQHQGGLVVGRGFGVPNTVAFSSADGIEYFPTASNSFDIPSTQSGFITAIASDTNDRLAVFKARAYYDVVGDLDGGAFSINVKAEGDFGIASQASLKRIQDTLIGVGQNGFLLISNGQFDSQAYRDLSARLIAQNYYFQWAVAENDAFNRNYVCSIPTTGEPVSFVIDYSRDKPHTFERSYTTKIDQGGGMALVDNTLYHLSLTSPYGVFRRLDRFDGNSPSGNGDGDSFIDNTNAITYILESSPINFGEPAQLKTPIRIRLWSIPNDYVEEGWVPFSTLIETGASAIAQYVGGSSPNATSSTVTFSTANDAFKEVKLVNCKTHFYIVRLTTNTIRTAPFWTGYEVLFKQAYVKEDLAK